MNRSRELIQQYGIKAKKKYGQNFLVDDNIIEKIAAALKPCALVLEIGAGLGSLTARLKDSCERLVAYEIDAELATVLKREFEDVEVVNEDFLNVAITEDCSVVSNVPYYISSALMMKLFRSGNKVREIVVMVQREFAERIRDENSPVRIIGELYYERSLVTRVSRKCFIPEPNVDSVVLKFEKNSLKADEELMKFIEDSFKGKRKVLLKNLQNRGYPLSEEIFSSLGYPVNVRCEQLNANDFVKIYEAMK